GRFVTTGDTAAGVPHVMVLTFEFWKQQFGGRVDALGKIVKLTIPGARDSTLDFTIVGVLPPGIPEFTGVRGIGQFVPLTIDARDDGEDSTGLTVFGRLRDGVTISAAEKELSRLARDVRGRTDEHTVGIVVHRLADSFGYLVPARFALLAIAGLVLVMAALNVANLLLARGIARTPETALRTALGASNYRIVRQFMAESFLVS